MSAYAGTPVQARRGGFLSDMIAVAGRGLRLTKRDPETVLPGLIFPVFFFAMNVGALESFAKNLPGLDYRAFQLPIALIFGVTGLSRATSLVLDIQSGYFDRLALTPANRLALLFGLMVADFVLIVALSVPVLALGFIVGVGFVTGVPGVLVFILLTAVWALAFAGFPYAIALKTGNPSAVNTSWLLVMPFIFMTTVFLPREAMTGWLATVARYNPLTYLLDALRSLLTVGWDGEALGKGVLAIFVIWAISLTLALLALRGRMSRN